MTHQDMLTKTVADLREGDSLLHLGGIGFPQHLDRAAGPVLILGAHLTSTSTPSGASLHQIDSTSGTFYACSDDAAVVRTFDTVTDETVLLISRRPSLHTTLLGLGTPIVRRTPLHSNDSVPGVSAQEWNTAPLVVVDAFLGRSTLRGMCSRSDIHARRSLVMIGTDPDNANIYARAEMVAAEAALVFPYDVDQARVLFSTMTRRTAVHQDILNS